MSNTTVPSTWANMANNSTDARKSGNSAVRVTISDNPVVDTWALPEGATPTIVQTVIPSDGSSVSDQITTPAPAKKEQDEVFVGKATVARRGRAHSVVIGNNAGIKNQACRRCGENGHFQKNCPEKATETAAQRDAKHDAFLERQARRESNYQAYLEREVRRQNAICHRCGEAGHRKMNCVNPSKEEQAKAALESRIEFAMAEGMTREEAMAGESALAAYEKRAEDEARVARAQSTRAQRKKTELVIGADQGSYELTNGGIVGAFKGYQA
ncbi:hypothetical protein BJ166DRAFT_596957 [Pestalotiopsis sp. NC0098]|nr:hypothetical protein BJ166DRAFT_596957 [Pestalotiopsis sp. NC0098]